MNWTHLNNTEQLNQIKSESSDKPIIIFKHSTRCSISRMVLDRLERNWKQEELAEAKLFFLDLLTYREISNLIAETFEVEHESPQVLIIQNGYAVFHTSHYDIDFNRIKQACLKASIH